MANYSRNFMKIRIETLQPVTNCKTTNETHLELQDLIRPSDLDPARILMHLIPLISEFN